MKKLTFTFILLLALTGCTTVYPGQNSGYSTNSADNYTSLSTSSMSDVQATDINPENTLVMLETNKGNFKLEIYTSNMPVTAGNFVKLVNEGFYNGVIFHRIIPDFMIQGGDPTGTGRGGPGYTIQDEFSDDNRNVPGTISMANAGPNTGGSQFFINLVDNSYLDTKHPVFGRVVEGMDVVEQIAAVQTDPSNRPLEDVTINVAKVVAE